MPTTLPTRGLRYWSRWFDEDSTRIDEAYAKLAYFDSKNFAPMVKCPCCLALAQPISSVRQRRSLRSITTLTCEKRHEFFEGFGHEEIQDFDDLIVPFFCKGGRLMSKCESNVDELIVPRLIGNSWNGFVKARRISGLAR